jgi:Protein of unknown function (DUF3667)
VSHRPERKDKDCLNCGSIVAGKYCQQCGQENIEPGMTILGLVQHFFYDITHFDGKYFDTLGKLFKKPGYLSKAFMEGKRASFVDPVKMYIFTSAFFFLLFYAFFLKVDERDMESGLMNINDLSDRLKLVDTTNNQYDFRNNYLILNNKDTILDLKDSESVTRFRDSVNQLLTSKKSTDTLSLKKGSIRIVDLPDYPSRKAYDSLQQLLPSNKRDNRLQRLMVYRQIHINEKYYGNTGKYIASLVDKFLHSFPTLLFISLPLLALLLKLLYIRKKEYRYVYHGIFLIHLFIFTFLMLIPFFITYDAAELLHWKIWGYIRLGIVIWLLVYLYKSMRLFYGQTRVGTFFKIWIFMIISFLIMLVVFILYFAFMALKG